MFWVLLTAASVDKIGGRRFFFHIVNSIIGQGSKLRMATASEPRKSKNAPKSLASSKCSASKSSISLSVSDWKTWCQHLAQRAHPRPLRDVVAAGKRTPFLWGLPNHPSWQKTEEQLRSLDKVAHKKKSSNGKIAAALEAWLSDVPASSTCPGYALECLAWCYALPALSHSLPAAPWTDAFDTLMGIAEENSALVEDRNCLTQQLLKGELPLTLAYVFPEIKECRQLVKPARELLSQGICELLDGKGMPHAENLEVFRALLACWTRCGFVSRAMGKSCFKSVAQNQFDWAVRQSLRLVRFDGKQVLGNSPNDLGAAEMIAAALELSEDEEDNAAARVVMSRGKASRKAAKRFATHVELPKPSVYSEWAQVASMRSSWAPSAAHFVADFSRDEMAIELNCEGATVFQGVWSPQVAVDGKPLLQQSNWSELCWYADKEVDYLELEAQFEGGWKVQRQMVLARQDQLLILADAILGKETAMLSYSGSLPLAEDVLFSAEEETWEGTIAGSRALGTVYPLGLAEWREDTDAGILGTCNGQLQLEMSQEARRLYAPLCFDLSKKRLAKKRTWRRLTVAEKLQIQPPDVAAGYRLQIGKEQWFFYRSLAVPANRSVLGQNTAFEFVFGRFNQDGTLEEIIEIE